MQYNVFYRPKLSRNKYNEVNNIYNGGSSFTSNSIFGNQTPVGAEMATLEQLSDFIGSTADFDGQRGLVPKPKAGHQLDFLQATGDFVDIPAYRWIKEWPFDEGLEKTGVGVVGDFHVSNNLSTLNLTVGGMARFWELVIDKCKANGGQVIISPSLFQVDYVGDIVTYDIYEGELDNIRKYRPDIKKYIQRWILTKWRCQRVWMKNNDNVDRTFSEVEVGDMMRCQTVNIDGHSSYNNTVMKDVANTVYWTFVAGQGKGTFTDNNGNEQEGLYIDLVFAVQGDFSENRYFPIDTLFSDDESNPVTIPENFVMPYLYDDLKKKTFETLCGSQEVTPEMIEKEDEIDDVTEYCFKIRGVGYIIAGILGEDYSDDSYASMYDMLMSCGMGENVLFGSDSDRLTNVMNKILGVDDSVYSALMLYEQNYAADITDNILNGGDFQYSEDGQYEPTFNQDVLEISKRTEWRFGFGKFECREKHQLACMGHLWNTDRQNAVILASIQSIDAEIVSPSIAQYTGIDIFGASVSQFRLNVIAKNGNIFAGRFMVRNDGAYIEVSDMINLFITDIETGLEAVGIHLSGKDSTITMKGSIELHQHNDKDDDTLSVWDSNNNKKVEIIPTTIPSIDDLQNISRTTYRADTTKVNSKRITYTIAEDSRWVDKNWWSWLTGAGWYEYRYKIQTNTIVCSGKIELPKYQRGDVLDISNININVYLSNGYFRSSISQYLKTVGDSCTVTLKLMWGITTIKSQTFNPTVPAGADSYTFNLSNFVDDYTVPGVSGSNFTLEYSIAFNICTDYTSWLTTQYAASNRYYYINYSHNASCDTIVTRNGESYMKIGTNGLVYAVGNGDYFYSGDSGMCMNFKENGLLFNERWGCKLYRKPQVITASTPAEQRRVHSEIVICKRGSSDYGIWLPYQWGEYQEEFTPGQVITIIGFIGLEIYSWQNKRFKIYDWSVGNYTTVDYIKFTSATSSFGSSGWYYLQAMKIQFVVAEDGMYII